MSAGVSRSSWFHPRPPFPNGLAVLVPHFLMDSRPRPPYPHGLTILVLHFLMDSPSSSSCPYTPHQFLMDSPSSSPISSWTRRPRPPVPHGLTILIPHFLMDSPSSSSCPYTHAPVPHELTILVPHFLMDSPSSFPSSSWTHHPHPLVGTLPRQFLRESCHFLRRLRDRLRRRDQVTLRPSLTPGGGRRNRNVDAYCSPSAQS